MSSLITILLLGFLNPIYIGTQARFWGNIPEKFVVTYFPNEDIGFHIGIFRLTATEKLDYIVAWRGGDYRFKGDAAYRYTGAEFALRKLIQNTSFLSTMCVLRNDFAFIREDVAGYLLYGNYVEIFQGVSTGIGNTTYLDLSVMFNFKIRGLEGFLEISAPLLMISYMKLQSDELFTTIGSTSSSSFTLKATTNPIKTLSMLLHIRVF